MPVLVLAGDEEFELSRKVAEYRSKLLDPTWAAMNFVRLDNAGLSTITEHASALPFGPGNKVILIDKCELFTKKRTKGGAADDGESSAKGKNTELDRFEDALGSVGPNTYLIFSCPHNFDKTLKTSKAVAKHAKIEEFAKPKRFPGTPSPPLEKWCQDEARRIGATIDIDAARYLIEGADGDLRQMASEIEKAAVHIMPKKHITEALVMELSPHQSHVFAVTENWVAGKHLDALDCLRETLSKQSAIPVLAAMQTILAKWVQMKALCDAYNGSLPGGPGVNRRELPAAELAKRLASDMKVHPFWAEKELKKIGKISSEKLIAKRAQLTKLEDLIKTGQMPDSHALELFIVG